MTRQGFVAMQARDWFGVAVRLIGFALVIYGFYDLFYLVLHVAGIDTPHRSDYPIALIAAASVFFFGLGGAIMAKAELIVRLAYRSSSST